MVFYNCGLAFLEDVSSRNEGTFLLEIMEGGLSCEIRVINEWFQGHALEVLGRTEV